MVLRLNVERVQRIPVHLRTLLVLVVLAKSFGFNKHVLKRDQLRVKRCLFMLQTPVFIEREREFIESKKVGRGWHDGGI